MTLTFNLIRDVIKVDASNKIWVSALNGSPVRALTDRQTMYSGYGTFIIPGDNFGTVVGEDSTPYVILTLWTVNGL